MDFQYLSRSLQLRSPSFQITPKQSSNVFKCFQNTPKTSKRLPRGPNSVPRAFKILLRPCKIRFERKLGASCADLGSNLCSDTPT